MARISFDSHAKVNLHLNILRKRPDGFHDISTIFHRISLADRITLKTRSDDKIKIITSSREIPKDHANLAFKSAKLLKDRYKIKKGVDIIIKKNIPVSSGMAGGSSNAAGVLMGLNRLWKLGLAKKQLVFLASLLGSDVAFFIYDCSFAKAEGRGQIIAPIRALKHFKLYLVIVVPKIAVSTRVIYRNWSQLSGLTMPRYDDRLITLIKRDKDKSSLKKLLFNGLEPVTFKLYPKVRFLKEKMRLLGMDMLLMSGSGPTVFAIASSKREAKAWAKLLKAQLESSVFTAETV
ncbi:MAG: 4-(cytidine 5'-diphospho)-2-C-methyl-D-erythritol kinase [Candidatus Omnitrophica bacterium]|jgi:4-diphosphocytidyl-2-C-methyl-D-erythritol kinase|nr:4-(cytidine 5'-diphospho)-2-C-methyl-D-erythritol kinase [Candidatus Omnitrophota bacterium]